jgi:hypothetical protein
MLNRPGPIFISERGIAMSPRELFVVLMKAMGVLEFVGGATAIPQFAVMFSRPGGFTEFPVTQLIVAVGYPGIRIVAGGLLFTGAKWIAAKAFPLSAVEGH